MVFIFMKIFVCFPLFLTLDWNKQQAKTKDPKQKSFNKICMILSFMSSQTPTNNNF